MTSEREAGSEGVKLSAEVKPFVPKYAAVTVAWSEPSEACVFPRYYATCYPYVQEPPVDKQQVCSQDVPWDTTTPLSQYSSQSLMGYSSLGEYTSSPYLHDATPNSYSVTNLQHENINTKFHSSSKQGRDYTKQTSHLRKEASYPSRRRPRDHEPKWETKRPDGNDLSNRSAESSSYTDLHERNTVKSDRPTKAMNEKCKQISNTECLPEPAFEITLSDFPKLQSLGNKDRHSVQKHAWGPLGSAEGDKLHLKPVAASAAKEAETRETVSDNELEEITDKKKKKRKKKKKEKEKMKENGEQEKLQSKSILMQEPPRIEDDEEFPDLAAATDKKYKTMTPKLCYGAAFTKEQTEIISKESGFESPSGNVQDELLTPKLVQRPGRLVRSAPIEKKKEQSKGSGKKSQIPVQLDLGGMLEALEQKQHAEKSKQSPKPVVLSVGGAVAPLSKESMVTKSLQSNQGKIPHNPLDSSAPLVKKGKQREVPKVKKPTSLKKIILKEREQRKQQHLLEQAGAKDSDPVQQSAESASENHVLSEDFKADSVEKQSADDISLSQGGSDLHLDCTEPSGSTENSLVPLELNSRLPKIHSRRFRDYCTQVLSKEVDSCVTDLLKELVRFQDRLYQKDPVKAKTKRRLVMGLREVLKHLKLKKLKCVIISPNCEKIQSKGGLDDTLHLIIDSACEQNIPFVFALNRKALGRCVNKAVPVSVVGIFSYDGAQDYFHKMVELTMEARMAYKEMIAGLEKESAEEENKSNCAHLKAHHKDCCQLGTGEESLPEPDEDVPNYIKIWKQKLEEEYNPYVLELEKQSAAEMSTLGFEQPQ